MVARAVCTGPVCEARRIRSLWHAVLSRNTRETREEGNAGKERARAQADAGPKVDGDLSTWRQRAEGFDQELKVVRSRIRAPNTKGTKNFFIERAAIDRIRGVYKKSARRQRIETGGRRVGDRSAIVGNRPDRSGIGRRGEQH